MLTFLTLAALSLGGPQPQLFPFQETTAAPAQDAAKSLAAATKAMAEAKSYRFTMTSETERADDDGGEAGGGRGGGRGFGGFGGDTGPTTGVFHQGLPLMLKAGETVAYKDGETLVHQGEAGEWQVFEPRAAFGGGRGRAGGDPGGDQGGRRGRGGDDAGGGGAGGAGERGQRGGFDRSLFTLMAVTPPHELLTDFPSKTASVQAAEENGRVVLSGDLTEDGARALGLGGRGRGFGGARGGGGGGGPEMTTTGSYRLELAEGKLVEAKLVITRAGEFGDRSFEMTTTRTIAFEGVGSTELEVPDEVLAHFEI